jgi:hypothetical protein
VPAQQLLSNIPQSLEPKPNAHLRFIVCRFSIPAACIGQLWLLSVVLVLPLMALLLPATLASFLFIA